MSLKAEDVRSVFKNKGFAWAAPSVMSTIVLGVTDQFTSRIVPSVADAIESYFHPPRFFITFVPPTDLSEGLAVSALGAEAATEVKTNRVGARGVAAHAGTGVYEVRLRRKREQTPVGRFPYISDHRISFLVGTLDFTYGDVQQKA